MERWIVDGTRHPEEKIGWKLRPRAGKLYAELEKLPHLTGYHRYEPFPDREEVPAIVLDRHSKAAMRRDDIAPTLVSLFDSAEHSILIQNPYVLLTKDLAEALIRASDRGVRIILHTNSPASSDNVFTQAFFLRDWKRMLADMPMARILAFPGPRPLHAKVFVIDDRVSLIGTYNLDPLSREVNSEVMVAVLSEAFAKENRRRIARDLAVSKEYTIRRLADGRVEAVSGSEKDLSGLSGFFIRLVSKLGFLKKMV
jgi:phosphatidylserine/phosphatidylglycerophosphate/cardiolipin synthase-like enzyme